MSKIYEALTSTGMPVAYGFFKEPQQLPFLCYKQNGQTNVPADDTFIHSEQDYQIEYYFKAKDEDTEETIEQALLANGYLYEKSEDAYIEDDKVFVIYYQV